MKKKKNHRKRQVKSQNGKNNLSSYVKVWTQINQRQMEHLQLLNNHKKMIVLSAEDVEENSIQQQLINIFQVVSRGIKVENDSYKILSH